MIAWLQQNPLLWGNSGELFIYISFLMEIFRLQSQCQLWFPALRGSLVKRHKVGLCRVEELVWARRDPHIPSLFSGGTSSAGVANPTQTSPSRGLLREHISLWNHNKITGGRAKVRPGLRVSAPVIGFFLERSKQERPWSCGSLRVQGRWDWQNSLNHSRSPSKGDGLK